MRIALLLLVLVFSGCAASGKALVRLGDVRPFARWDPSSQLRADFDCDGAADVAALGHQAGDVVVGVALGSGAPAEAFQFAISGSRQDAICSEPATLELHALEEDPPEDVHGFRKSQRCKGLRLTGEFCRHDVILYWNHETKHLDWWRR